jgi:hypothetical protein
LILFLWYFVFANQFAGHDWGFLYSLVMAACQVLEETGEAMQSLWCDVKGEASCRLREAVYDRARSFHFSIFKVSLFYESHDPPPRSEWPVCLLSSCVRKCKPRPTVRGSYYPFCRRRCAYLRRQSLKGEDERLEEGATGSDC